MVGTISDASRFTLQAQLINVFDRKMAIGYCSNRQSRQSVNVGDDSQFSCSLRDPEQLVALRRSHSAIIYDEAWFKTPNTYQAPREMRLAVELAF